MLTHAGVTWKVYLALGSSEATSLYGTAVYGTGTYGGSIPEWVDVSEWVTGIYFNRGAERLGDRMRTGHAEVSFDNHGGRFNPDHGNDVLPGSLTLRPGRWLKVEAFVDPTTYLVWAGFIDSVDEVYPDASGTSEMLLRCFDFASMLALHNPTASSSQGSGETTGARVERVLDDYGWLWQDVDTGNHTMQATTLADNYLELCQQAAVGEAGAFFLEGLTATFRDSDFPSATTPSAELGYNYGSFATGYSGGIGLLNAASEWSAQNVRNDIQVARDGGSVISKTDTASWARYGRRTWRFLDYKLDNDTDVGLVGQKLLDAYAYDYQRLASVTVSALGVDAAEELLPLTIGDLVSVKVPIAFGDWEIDVDCHIFGIEYNVTADDWTITYRLDNETRGDPE